MSKCQDISRKLPPFHLADKRDDDKTPSASDRRGVKIYILSIRFLSTCIFIPFSLAVFLFIFFRFGFNVNLHNLLIAH
jgi:hypothetical protein